jgi:hypothetical protein
VHCTRYDKEQVHCTRYDKKQMNVQSVVKPLQPEEVVKNKSAPPFDA